MIKQSELKVGKYKHFFDIIDIENINIAHKKRLSNTN